jgi:hypothetical protein
MMTLTVATAAHANRSVRRSPGFARFNVPLGALAKILLQLT